MMRLVLRIVEFGWQGPRQGPRVMEGLRLRDASYSRHSPRPSATAGKNCATLVKKIPHRRPDQLTKYVQPMLSVPLPDRSQPCSWSTRSQWSKKRITTVKPCFRVYMDKRDLGSGVCPCDPICLCKVLPLPRTFLV